MDKEKNKSRKRNKGEYGYIDRRKRVQIMYTLCSFGAAIGIFVLSYFLSGHTRNNVGTVLAVVMMLPACKCMVGVILIFPHKTIKRQYYDLITSSDINAILLYDMLLTSNERPMHIDAAAVGDDRLIMFVPDVKQDKKFIRSYFQKVMDSYGLNATVSVTDNIKQFIRNAGEIKETGDNAQEIKKTVLIFGF